MQAYPYSAWPTMPTRKFAASKCAAFLSATQVVKARAVKSARPDPTCILIYLTSKSLYACGWLAPDFPTCVGPA